MSQIHVGIGEYHVSDCSETDIKTFALGSCVAVITYNTETKRTGLIHIALPDSAVNPEKAGDKPGYFVDTGLPVFLNDAKGNGSGGGKMWIKVVGGSNIMDDNNRFNIGKRNVLAIKKYLWKRQLGIIAEETGGTISRTVNVCVATGKVTVFSSGKTWEL